MRLRPRPVSMLLAGSGVAGSCPAAVGSGRWSYCMKTRFQYSRKRSFSPPGRSLGRAELETTIDVELRAGPAGAAGAGLPEVLRAGALDDPLARHAELQPALDRLLVGPEAEPLVAFEDRHPDVLLAEAEDLAGELPGEGDRLVLEVVAEGEVAEHLEEGEVAGGVADVVDVDRPEDLLTVRQALRRRGLLAEEVGLQRDASRRPSAAPRDRGLRAPARPRGCAGDPRSSKKAR